jgi:outer membrane receptor protein involved in Fe transport
MKFTLRRSCLLLVTVLILAVGALHAQSNSATIEGIVRDTSGAVIPNVTIVALNVATGIEYRGRSNETGYFRISPVERGTYTLTVTAPNFADVTLDNLTIDANAVRNVEVTMKVAGTQAQVEVHANASVTDTTTSEVSSTIHPKEMMDLPINGRDFTRLALLTPGVNATYSNLSSLTFNGSNSELSGNNFLLDGTDATNIENNRPSAADERGPRLQTGSLEGIEEFKVSQGNYSAEYGRAGGSVVQITSKSGTNGFNGDLFEFFRNNIFDARNFFDPSSLPFHLNQFGGTLGGPIIRDKTFFFVNYEGSRERIGETGVGTDPPASALVGLDPALQNLAATFPTPVSLLNPTTGVIRRTGSLKSDENVFAVKLDHNFSANDRLSFRYSYNDGNVGGPAFALYNGYLGLDQVQNSDFLSQFYNVGYTHVFSPSLVNEFRFGVNRKHYDENNGGNGQYPEVTIGGYNFIAGTLSQSLTNSHSIDFGDSVSWVKGRHALRFGVSFRKPETTNSNNGFSTAAYTNLNGFLNNQAGYAYVEPAQPSLTFLNWNTGYYAQDDWRVSDKLTLNLGLRYDYNTVVGEQNGRLGNYVGGTGPNFVGGHFTTPGTPLYQPDRNNFAPRLGFAYNISGNGNTVIRGGFGVFYSITTLDTSETGISNPPGLGIFLLLPSPGSPVSIPLPDPTKSGIPLALSPVAVSTNLRDGYTQQYSLNVQQKLGATTVLQVGYFGSGARHQLRYRYVNYPDPTTHLRPDPLVSNILLYESAGSANYNALQVSLNRSFTSGFMYGASYTYSHLIDDMPTTTAPQNTLDMAAERGNGDSDVRHNLALNTSYVLPIDRWLRANRVTEGWQINGIGLVRSGLPLNVQLGYDSFGNSSYNERPDRVPGVSVLGHTSGNVGFINPAAFTDPAPGTYGNAGRNIAIGPSFHEVDFSVIKDTKLTERQAIQFRWEVFNVFNMPTFSTFFVDKTLTSGLPGTRNPDFAVASQTFARTVGVGTSRQMQFGLKYIF